jgi:hypothetical protein
MDGTRRHPCPLAKMPPVFSGLRCGWNRIRVLGVDRHVPADISRPSVPGVAVIRGCQTGAPSRHADTYSEGKNESRRAGVGQRKGGFALTWPRPTYRIHRRF